MLTIGLRIIQRTSPSLVNFSELFFSYVLGSTFLTDSEEEIQLTDPSYTAIKLVVDRSGSMQSVLDDMQGAIRTFLQSQRSLPGRVTVRIAQFDSEYELVCPSTPISDLADYTLIPRGRTALWDAFGFGLSDFGEELAALPEDQRPGTVVFVLVTDGQENSSQEWDATRVKELVVRQSQEYGWKIVFLGANQDALVEGSKLGVSMSSSLTYNGSKDSVRSLGHTLSSYVARAASGAPVEFSPAERSAAHRR